MSKIALVTGATDGIGRATALELARDGYTLHILGRNRERGESALAAIREISPERNHRVFRVDLGSIPACNGFLDDYIAIGDRLELLVLNANAYTKKTSLSAEGIETTFAVGCVSRYLFSVRLSPLMEAATNARVVHIGDARSLRKIDYRGIARGSLSILKATGQSYSGDTLMAHFLNPLGHTRIPHETIYPGVVNTRQIREQPLYIRLLAKLLGLLEPEESGRRIAAHIRATVPREVAGKYFKLEREARPSRRLAGSREAFEALVRYLEEKTGVPLDDMV